MISGVFSQWWARDGTRVRLNFSVLGRNQVATPEKLVQLKIRYDKSISAPQFSMPALGQEAVEVSRGQQLKLEFAVSSSQSGSVVSVNIPANSLPGAPTITCAPSAEGASKQSCVMSWNVPCDTTEDKLTGSIAMTAISTVEGRESETTTYTLKTAASKEDKKLCEESK